ncbi:MAG: hypothetical protein ACKVQS_13840 [Fimbriimonadaceae bacterium]
MRLPFTARRIQKSILNDPQNQSNIQSNQFLPFPSPFQTINEALSSRDGAKNSADLVIYNANAGIGYSTFPGVPSSLDDVNILSAGLGKPWTSLTFGFHYGSPTFSKFLVRWRMYESNIDNPAGQNDFSGEFADFGGYIVGPYAEGDWVAEVNVVPAAVSTTDSSIFIAQQFRVPHLVGFPPAEDGEGEFDGVVDCVYNNAAEPSTGSSLNQFWYDWDPIPDGKYENTEIDQFETGFANHVLTIKVAATGAVSNLTAIDARMGIGRFVSGNLISVLTAGDNNEFKINESYLGGRTSPVGAIEVDFLQSLTNITGIRISGTAGVSILGCDQWIDIYNFTTNSWVQLASKPGIPLGSNTFNEAYGGTVPISQFVGTVTHPFFGNIPVIRARVRFKNTVFTVPRNWQMKLDQLSCAVTTP